jgi:hypothetical protein
MKKYIIFLFLFSINFVYATVTATPDDKKGYLVNMNTNGINNVSYSALGCNGIGSYSGKTGTYISNSTTVNEDGVFIYKVGCESITFFIKSDNGAHEIKLSQIETVTLDNSDYKLTYTELAGAQRTATNDDKAKKIARLLLSLDNDSNPKNAIDVNSSNINNSIDFTPTLANIDIEELNNTIKAQYGNTRHIIDELCAVVHMERALRSRGHSIDTVPPCKPELAFDLNATSNNTTYVELIGEENTKIYLNGVDTGLMLDENGVYEEFRLSTQIELNSYDEFNLSLVDSKGVSDPKGVSEVNSIRLFNDPDQPNFNNLPASVNAISTNVIDLNVSDTSKDHGLSDFPALSLKYEIFDNNGSSDSNYFTVEESTGILQFKDFGTAPNKTYYIKIKVTDEVLHYVETNLTIIK